MDDTMPGREIKLSWDVESVSAAFNHRRNMRDDDSKVTQQVEEATEQAMQAFSRHEFYRHSC
eukprot:5074401-Karenia_brevis.AAC.1